MKLGLFIPHIPNPMFEAMAAKAEALAFHHICCDDHLISPFAPPDADDFGCYEAWTAMAYLAGRTRKVKLSHMALVPAFRGPGVMANMAATLDRLSGGRVILTVGAGWFKKEFIAYQIPWDKHRQRIEREREIIQIIRALWTQPEVDFDGRYYQLRAASLNPKPLQQPSPPIIISGDSRPSLELAAELGDGWLMHGRTPGEAERLISRIRPHLGAKTERFDIAIAVVVVFGEDKTRARRKLKSRTPEAVWDLFMQADIKKEIRGGVYGTPAHCIDQLKAYEAAGITSMTLVFPDPADLDLFLKEVMTQWP